MIKFIEETHQYFDGEKELISVTTLMKKHGLAPNYDGVNAEVLRAKAERGSLIHKEIEDYIKQGSVGFTEELAQFADYLKVWGIEVIKSEEIAYNDITAGTVDLLLKDNGTLVIADIKTTATLHKDAVSWQLSIYAYLLGLDINKGQAFHFDKNGKLDVVDISLKPVAEVEKLMECERNGELYKQELTNVSQDQLAELATAEKLIKYYENLKKAAEEQAKIMRAALLEAMELNGVKKYETEALRITYTAPSTQDRVDTDKLKEDGLYANYIKKVNVKAKLTITIKEEK